MRHLVWGVSVLMGMCVGILITMAFNAHARPPVEIEIVEDLPVVVPLETEEQRTIRRIRETFPEDPDTAVAIARAESNLNTTAFNPERHRGCTGSVGVMQIACVHHPSNPEELKGLELNLQIARSLYEKQGWRPWGVCTNGTVYCGLI